MSKFGGGDVYGNQLIRFGSAAVCQTRVETSSSKPLESYIMKSCDAYSQSSFFCSLREKYPNHPALAALNSRPNTSGVMYDENGERAYTRLPPAPENGSQHEPNFGTRTAQRPENEQASGSGNRERDAGDGLRERIRADLERRRQQGGIPSEGAGPVLEERYGGMSGAGREGGMGWEKEHRMWRKEDGGDELLGANGAAQVRPEVRRQTEVGHPSDI